MKNPKRIVHKIDPVWGESEDSFMEEICYEKNANCDCSDYEAKENDNAT